MKFKDLFNEFSAVDYHQLKLIKKIIQKNKGDNEYKEAVKILKTKWGYSDEQVQGVKDEV
jgi:hypothetical protein